MNKEHSLTNGARWHNRMVRGEETPRALLERVLERIATRDPHLHAFVCMSPDSARAAADAATQRYRDGHPLGPLDGCPVAIKDIIETQDLPTQMGSAVFSGWYSGRDAACVAALRQHGAVVIGKTHTTEFAIGRSAPTVNPFDAQRTPGGSSSGSAAAVGAGLVPVALATQTVGSILRPASYCGAFGFKPSHGALTTAGIHPLSRTLDHLGAIGESLQDVWAAAHCISRTFGASLGAHALAGQSTLPEARRAQRIGCIRTSGWHELDESTKDVFSEWLERVRATGCEVVTEDDEISALNAALDDAGDRCMELVRFEMRYPMRLYRERHEHELSERVRGLLDDGEALTADDHQRMLEARARLRAHVHDASARFDAFISLASSGPASLGLEHTGSREFLAPWTLIGGPAYTLPLLECVGLPLGVQLMGYSGRDRELCAIARWLWEQHGAARQALSPPAPQVE